MHYLSISAWIFAFLIFMVALLFLYPATYIIGLSVIFLPLFIVIQAVIILKAKDQAKPSGDQRWYEHHN
ncbi:MAG: hypothetical protein ACK4TA_19785 [Saprospiraceae bacterium]